MKLLVSARLKSIALCFGLIVSGSVLYTNCSQRGFQMPDTAGESNLASSEPTAVAVNFKDMPADMVTSDSVSFSYDLVGTNLSSVSIRCFLNGAAQPNCSNPLTLSGLDDNDHTFSLDAVNQNGLVLAEAKRSFRIDRKAPVLMLNQAPSGSIGTTSVSIAFSVTDNFPGASAFCALDSAAFVACNSPLSLSNLTSGAHSVKIYAQDKAGNKSATQTVSFSVNLAVPTVMLSAMPAAFTNMNSASFSFSGMSSSSTIASYQCSFDNGAFAACTSPVSYMNLAEGSHNFSVKALDALGQMSSPANFSFAVDLTKPSVPVVSSNAMTPSKTNSLNLTFNSTDTSGIAKYECKLDAGAYTACVSPQAFANLSSASHVFLVRATDKAGNISSEGSYTIVIDTVAPVVTISSQPANPTSSTAASFSFTVSDALSGVNLVECQIDNQMYENCTSPKAYSNLAAGNHTFNLRGTDKAGNSTLQSYAWSIAAAATPTPAPSMTPNPSDACPYLTLEQQRYPNATVKNAVTSYGLKGDGVSDEYDAFQKISAEISGKQFTQRMIVYFPKGNYYINRYVKNRGTNANTNKHVKYANASNFSIIGCTGALINIKGDFLMTNDTTYDSGAWYTYTEQLNPFLMDSSSNFRVSGFEINGNVNKMTRQMPTDGKDLAEPDSFGVLTSAAKNYEFSHMKIHHFSSDAILVGGDYTADDGGVYDDIDVYNNARQGVSVIQAVNMTFKNSTFRDTGFDLGAYPRHAPVAGVDIEPNWNPSTGASALTGNIVFDNCTFKGNSASQFVTAGNGAMVTNVTIRNSTILNRPNGFPLPIIMSISGGIIENNYIDTTNGAIYPAWNDEIGSLSKVTTIVRGNTIVSSAEGLINDLAAKITVENNTFVSNHKPNDGGTFPNLENGIVSFTGNKLSYPIANWGTNSNVAVIKSPVFTNNTFTTDRTNGNYVIKVSAGTSRTNNTVSDHIQFGQ